MTDLITAARTQLKYASNEVAGRFPKIQGHLDKADAFLARAAAAPVTKMAAATKDPNVTTIVVDPGYFVDVTNPDEVYLTGGTPAGNPNGVSFTLGQAIAWWKEVFSKGLNIGHVRSTLTPGSHVLTPEGLAAAQELARTSTNYAAEDFNPLGLEVIP